jgi:alanine dehydrogenase
MTTTFDEMLNTKLQEIDLGTRLKTYSVGFLADDHVDHPMIISLEQIHHLVENNIQIYIQRGFGKIFGISDLEFSERGAEMIDDVPSLFYLSNMVIKYDPFTLQELQYLKNNQILVSTIHDHSITQEIAIQLFEKKITAFGINYIADKNGQFLFQNILENTLSNSAKTIAIGVITSSVIMSFTYDRNIRQTIQLNPEFLNSIYCYQGDICNPVIAAHAGVPWKDILGLCWDWN